MTMRTRITTFVIAGAIAFSFSAPAVAATHSSSNCGTAKSSAASTYGGQGTQISQLGCNQSATPADASSALPFTGLDIGLLVAAGAVLVTAGMVLRWRLRHGGQ
jgi:hypothetical protein